MLASTLNYACPPPAAQLTCSTFCLLLQAHVQNHAHLLNGHSGWILWAPLLSTIWDILTHLLLPPSFHTSTLKHRIWTFPGPPRSLEQGKLHLKARSQFGMPAPAQHPVAASGIDYHTFSLLHQASKAAPSTVVTFFWLLSASPLHTHSLIPSLNNTLIVKHSLVFPPN